MLTHFSLFTGIGGIDLAAEWAGFTTVGQCEWADYPTKVLEKHWPDVPRWRDIRSVTRESVQDRGIGAIDLISGGFPCQPFSVAGKRKGNEDDRYLWPEMLRVISELQPRWVLGENVAGIVTLALDKVLSDMENINYSCEAVVIPACAVNAPHRRDRTFIIAENANRIRCDSKEREKEPEVWRQWEFGTRSIQRIHRKENVAHSEGVYVEGLNNGQRKTQPWGSGWRETEPRLGRVADGVSDRVDRLKCLGNAVVPQQVYPILKAIADIENSLGA